jgi:hypothetical protein
MISKSIKISFVKNIKSSRQEMKKAGNERLKDRGHPFLSRDISRQAHFAVLY